ncbi:MAG: UspA domain protein [Gaiellaceae bacterium]|jgi:nucleotide-binding universal stress UspA family protein|nr:UspA domain protein [Gaiellaceae bacterium]
MSTTQESARAAGLTQFAHVVVGIDGSPEAREAARQAARLTDGELAFVAAYDPAEAIVGGTAIGVPVYADERALRARAESALREAATVVAESSAATELVRGRSWEALLAEVERRAASLVVVGSHGNSRLGGVVLGSTATELVHKAPCSVLVARTAGADFPSRLAVGVDGSAESAAAHATAKALSDRFGASLWPVVAHGGGAVDRGEVERIVGVHREDSPHGAVAALLAASAESDLLVVGSRGLHGLRALGSVSERIAHRARCSVLVVR